MSDRCGTMAGYADHRKNGTPTCRACKDARNDYQRRYRMYGPQKHGIHGTYGGYKRHLRNRTQPCTECLEAHNEYQQRRRALTARNVLVPTELLVELYLSSPPEVQVKTEDMLGAKRLEVLVQRVDEAAA
ncbi:MULTISPECIES: hypothetical protein [Rhodococcus]|uniref:hypothetical protein n=1 Tax=Rhodococcus TaxID=1827 RepID=UPI00143ED812|nr:MULTISPECIES: hypothetical protein [Rhodococcus]QIX48913.1 hypothetical protein HFP48_04655 [Rhodococcus sp. DMU1]QRI76036.1 hypothetical protein JQ505_26775 [Rhodococcus aetherivorans]QSE59447.1 hypothetical protein JYA75_27875 [Rhodococcus sp. PSBB066]QSE69228.1 hypothetical protein JYA91_27580 [Rhodococcus sp. PSBB049]